jgi:hypothetical protein
MHKALDALASDMECGERGRSTPIAAREKTSDERDDRTREGKYRRGAPRAWRYARRIAILIAVLAAALALADMGEKGAQNAYLTHHIAVTDDWAFYQAKNMRATVWAAQAGVLANLPNAADAGPQAEIKRARDNEARMRDDPQGGDGMKQLGERAKGQEAERDAAFHRYHEFELVVGALQIAIVLASVSVVTRVTALALGAGVIGCIAAIYGVLVAQGVI